MISGPLALTICGLMYMLANVSYYACASKEEISSSGVTVAGFFIGRVFNRNAERAFRCAMTYPTVPRLRLVLTSNSVLIALSSLSNVMSVTFAHARVNQELAKEGIIPGGAFWASSWPSGAPSAGLFLHLIPTVIMITAIPFGQAFNFIINVEQYARAVIFFFVVVGLFILRRKKPHGTRPFKVWNPVAVFFALGQILILLAPFLKPPRAKHETVPYWIYPIVGICVFLVGVIYWLLWRRIFPKIGKYELEEKKITLEDGTVVISFSRKKRE
jgi:amino acid transporter